MNRELSSEQTTSGLLTRLVRARRLGPEAINALREDVAKDSRIGFGYLGIGAIVAGVMLCVRGLAVFVLNWSAYNNPWLTAGAWALAAIAMAGACLIAHSHGSHLPTKIYAIVLALLAVAVVIDLISSSGFAGPTQVTVIVGAGATLLALVAYRPLNQLIVATLVLATLLVVVAVVNIDHQLNGTRPQIEVIVAAIAPTLIGILIVKSFGRFIERELDRTLVESTISSPRFTAGILGSEELARLDLRAEQLLSKVAIGHATLPLDPVKAAAASSLATELRLQLVAGHRQTWLQHAIEDSEFLKPTVSLSDPLGLAGYLNSEQRAGLLSAIWLMAAAGTRAQPMIVVSIGPQSDASLNKGADMIAFPIAISVDGIPRRRIDVTIWGALDRVGKHVENTKHGTLWISLSVQVATPDLR